MKPRQRGSKEQHANGTGGVPSSRTCLTACEERDIAFFGVSAVSGQPYSQERGFNTAAPVVSVPAIEYACDSEDIVVQVPNSPALHFPPSSPLPPSSLLPASPATLPIPLPSFPPLRVRVRRDLKPQQRSRFFFGPSTSEPRRNAVLTTFDRIVQIFTAADQRLLDIDERRLVLEEERERRRLVLEEERERRRLVLEEERERLRLVLEKAINRSETLADIRQRVLGYKKKLVVRRGSYN